MEKEIENIIRKHIEMEEGTMDLPSIIQELKARGLTKSNLLSENIPELKEQEKKKEHLCPDAKKECKWYLNCYECEIKEKLKEKTLDLVIDTVEIQIRQDRKVILVNAPNCVLRICQIKKLILNDESSEDKDHENDDSYVCKNCGKVFYDYKPIKEEFHVSDSDKPLVYRFCSENCRNVFKEKFKQSINK